MENKVDSTKKWLKEIIIDLNLCPFAHNPYKNTQINFTLSSPEELEATMLKEIQGIEANNFSTSLVIYDAPISFREFLNLLDYLSMSLDPLGTYQFIAFHPDFKFETTEDSDRGNLVNRSPFPTIHILLNAELDELLSTEEAIGLSERNEVKLNKMSQNQINSLFSYLKR